MISGYAKLRGLASPLIFYRETSKTALLCTRQQSGGSGFSADLLHSVDEGQLDLSFTSTPGDPARSVLARCREHSL